MPTIKTPYYAGDGYDVDTIGDDGARRSLHFADRTKPPDNARIMATLAAVIVAEDTAPTPIPEIGATTALDTVEARLLAIAPDWATMTARDRLALREKYPVLDRFLNLAESFK